MASTETGCATHPVGLRNPFCQTCRDHAPEGWDLMAELEADFDRMFAETETAPRELPGRLPSLNELMEEE